MNIYTLNSKKKEDDNSECRKWNTDIENEIRSIIKKALSKSTTSSNTNTNNEISEYIFECFQTYYNRPCDNIISLKKRNKKQLGDIFEHFSVMYLQEKGYGKVWLIGNTPQHILDKLNLKRQDLGIDIIIERTISEGKDEENRSDVGYFAVQAKWRSKTNSKDNRKIGLTWNMLSTYYALCARTGPWLKYIVITNADYIRRIGKKFKMDQSIVKGSFIKNCDRLFWYKLAGYTPGYVLNSNENKDQEDGNTKIEKEDTKIDIKKLRMKFLSKF